MNVWVKALVVLFVGGFALLALILAISGESGAAIGALMIAALISPALLEVWRPGKYVFRKPDDGSPDTMPNRMKQFRIDHPGVDGTLALGALKVLGIAAVASALFGFLKTCIG